MTEPEPRDTSDTDPTRDPTRATPDTVAIMARARLLMGARYALEVGVDPRFTHVTLHTNRIALGVGLACLAAVFVSKGQMELIAIAVSAMIARVIYVQTLIRKLDTQRMLAEGEARAWADRLTTLDPPPSRAMITTALDALNHPYATVLDLARQCTTIAALEASRACRQRHGVASVEKTLRQTPCGK